MRWNRLIALVAIGFIGLACDDSTGPNREVTLRVVDLTAPTTVPAGSGFTVVLLIETSGCETFDRLDASRTAARVDLTAIGRDNSGPGIVCPAVIQQIGREYLVQPPFTDPFTVAARQPDGSQITRTVRVQ